ncbi:MAG: CHAD domain-containing protein, partial [Burkholderiales bacterium]
SWSSLLALDAARALRGPVRQCALAALARRYRQVCRRGRGLPRLRAAELHRLRIAAKKLRYAAMFFAPLFPGRHAAAMLAALEALQDTLGGIHDCATATRLIEEARTNARGALLREAQALLASRNDAALADHRRQLKAGWKAFRAADRFWEREGTPRAARYKAKAGEPGWT